ncbi:unnamed protein product [Mytilus coruscus]|uniref:Uncharacterized protein n=1 Tax=Mytilus coruscus TaxID=42192 RepID=A0A6J8A1Q1_MYTCO|nr:unnamed protein product [Mytilus coruscus]
MPKDYLKLKLVFFILGKKCNLNKYTTRPVEAETRFGNPGVSDNEKNTPEGVREKFKEYAPNLPETKPRSCFLEQWIIIKEYATRLPETENRSSTLKDGDNSKNITRSKNQNSFLYSRNKKITRNTFKFSRRVRDKCKEYAPNLPETKPRSCFLEVSDNAKNTSQD